MAMFWPTDWATAAQALGLAALVAGCCLLAARAGRRGRLGRRGFVTCHSAHRAWLRDLRLCEADDFLNLDALIISGHPGRQVCRLTLGTGAAARVVYLKREQTTRWTTRLGNFLAGFGWVSRPVREAQVLESLQRDNLPGPRWLATGEDAQGQAFLLVEDVPGAIPLTRALQGMPPRQRRRLAGRLGELLGRLHEAGFFHRDLYAKHVLVASTGELHLLDWQRAWRGAWITRAARVRDLAALHATLPDAVAGPRERLAFLRAYAGTDRSGRRCLARAVLSKALHLLRRRHVREKRQPPTDTAQAWICLDGQSLCITPALAELYAGEPPAWLALDRQELPPDGREAHRPIDLPAGRQAILSRRRGWPGLGCLVRSWLSGRPLISRHQRRATLLWRLEKHGVIAPRVLAVGQRRSSARVIDSFLLVEPPADPVGLSRWLAGRSHTDRSALLAGLGVLLANLHEACCYLDARGLEQLSVQATGDEAIPVLEDVEGVTPLRKPDTRRARADLARLRRWLAGAGCPEAEWRRCEEGYRSLRPEVAEVPACAAPPRPAESRERASLWRRLVRGGARLHARPDWPEFAGADWVARIMDAPVTDRYFAKQGRSTGRWVLESAARPLVVYLKRHYGLPRWRGLLAALWPGGDWSPAMQEYNHLEWARRQGVPVPGTAACGELIGPWGRLRSFLAVEELTGMIALHEALPLARKQLGDGDFRRWKRGLVAELARLARLLHDRRHFHKDLYLCHFFIRQEDTAGLPGTATWRGRVFLIDLHRLGHHPWTWWLWQWKDLAQLLYSSALPGVDVRDQVAFWRHYRGPGQRRRSWRWLRRAVLFKWRLYRRHNQKRQGRRA